MARRTALAYLGLAALWILLSDQAVGVFTSDPAMIERISMAKGWLFVAVTAALLFLALRKQLARVEEEAAARHKAARELGESEERQRLFIEHAPASLAMFDREMRYLAASRRWLVSFGLVGREVIGCSHYDLLPDLAEHLSEAHRRGLAGEVVAAKADPFRRQNGTVQWLQWEVRPWRNPEGEVGGIVIFTEDISERIAAEGTLRESEARYRLLAEHVGDVVWVMNAATLRFDYVSPSVERLRGFSVDEVMAEPATSGMAPESVAMLEATFPVRLAAFEAGDPAAVTQTHEIRQRCRDGSWIWVEVVTTLVRSPRGGAQVVGVSRSIDGRKRAERELQDSEERFRSVVETAPVAIFIHVRGHFTYANSQAVALFGVASAADLFGRSVVERFEPSCRPLVEERLRPPAHALGAPPEAEFPVRRPDGTVSVVALSAVAFLVRETDGVLVFGRDVTEQRRAREELEFHESLLRETGAIAKVGGWSFDPKTGTGYWTEEVARIHDMEPTATTSLAIGLEYYRGDARHRIEAAVRAAVERGEPYDLQLELVTAAGRRKWVRTIGHPVVEGGEVVRVRGSFQDLTELHEAERSLRESEARFRELAETINEVFWITDPHKHRMLYVSPAYERVWGRSCASLYEAPDRWIETVHPDDRVRVGEAIGSRQITGEYNETYRIVRPDGGIRTVQDRAFPVRDEAGAVVRVVGVAEDVTETKRLEQQFLRSQRLEAVGALAGGVAHDLNNILTPVLMSVGLLNGEPDPGKARDLLAVIEQSTRRGAEIIKQLLAFSRGIDGEKMVLQPRHLIREMATLIRETFPRSIALTVDVAADLWPVEANSTQLHQVLMNLCVNARDAMPDGGQLIIEARNLTVSAESQVHGAELKPGPHIVIGVVDTGEGIDPDKLGRIFEPFFTSKAPGKGTGLGLSTVLGIVRGHGGHVGVYSEKGKGSRFRVYLPAKPGSVSDADAPGLDPARGRGELVLVVDDEEAIRSASKKLLERHGYRVITAANGAEALSAVLESGAGLRVVVTDVMMPGMDGIALARALRAIDPTIAIIATSGLDDEIRRTDLRECGVRELLPKPCEAGVLLHAVRAALETP